MPLMPTLASKQFVSQTVFTLKAFLHVLVTLQTLFVRFCNVLSLIAIC